MESSSPVQTSTSAAASSENQSTAVLGLAVLVFFLVFAGIVSVLPFPASWGFWPRAGVCVACAYAGGIFFMIAGKIVAFSYKAVVELAAALVLLANAVFIAAVWANFVVVADFLVKLEIMTRADVVAAVVAGAAALLFVANLLALFVLHPLARIAGTRLDLE